MAKEVDNNGRVIVDSTALAAPDRIRKTTARPASPIHDDGKVRGLFAVA
jgi:hypothetical protein